MALPASGQISMSQVNTELTYSATAQISLNDAAVRSLAGVSSGAISLDNLHGKSASFAATISASQLNLDLRTWALANGWNGSSAATITIASGVYIWANSTSTAALTINGSWPGGVSIVNNGFIMGQGGQGGGSVGGATVAVPGASGGPAISLGASVSITSTVAYIGGGGGGGGVGSFGDNVYSGGGGGAGGGEGGGKSSYGGIVAGGGGGAIGASGGNGGPPAGTKTAGSGGGGGRIMPGSGGSAGTTSPLDVGGKGGGAGGGGGAISICSGSTGNGGAGGAGGAAGSNSPSAAISGGAGGGGWGASGGSATTSYLPAPVAGGAGGKAIALNGYVVTWVGGFPSAYIFGAVS